MDVISGYVGKCFEDFKEGEKIIHRFGRTVTFEDNKILTHIFFNTAPLHFDKEYMEMTEFKQPLLVATMTIGMVCGIASEEFKNIAGELEVRDLRFRAPVFDGDTIHVETEVLEVKEHPEREDVGIVRVKHKAYKDNFKTLVCEFERVLLVYKRKYLPRWKLPSQKLDVT